jgi:hypothetical protein
MLRSSPWPPAIPRCACCGFRSPSITQIASLSRRLTASVRSRTSRDTSAGCHRRPPRRDDRDGAADQQSHLCLVVLVFCLDADPLATRELVQGSRDHVGRNDLEACVCCRRGLLRGASLKGDRKTASSYTRSSRSHAEGNRASVASFNYEEMGTTDSRGRLRGQNGPARRTFVMGVTARLGRPSRHRRGFSDD